MISKFYLHWKDVPKEEWHWHSFTPQEIACRGTGNILIVPDGLNKLQALRDIIGLLILNSAYRSPSHNKAVGGSPNSKHLLGIAYDVQNDSKRFTQDQLIEAAIKVGFNGIGRYDTFTHIDARQTPARWDLRTKKIR